MTLQPNYRLLLIDDNRAIHEDFRKILCADQGKLDQAEAEFFGDAPRHPVQPVFAIDSAFHGAEGVVMLDRAVAEGRPYAMAFIDVRMPPGMDGIATAEWIWRLHPDLQVVICTAYSDYSWEEMVGRLGHRDRLLVLKKPFAAIEALQLACALCEKWNLTREAREHLAETERIVGERTRELRETNARLQAEIAQRQEAEEQLLRAQRLESIGTLASGIAHDLNNMLSPILMGADLLRAKVPESCHDLIALIENSAGRASSVVKQVLTFARGIEGERTPILPAQWVRDVEEIAAEIFPRSIRVETCIPQGFGLLIEGDPTQLHQVLLNLCVNARDAMPAGGTLRLEVDEFAVDGPYASMRPDAKVGQYVRLRVSDTGSGMPPALLGKIFDPFFTTKPVGQGTGLGLSTTIGIIRSHAGFIEVESQVGEGSTFAIFLPAALGGAPAVVAAESAAGHAGHGELILVVDDERNVRKVTEAVLCENGYRTLGAADGAEALSLFAVNRIDAVFTDIMMPVVDGVALCRALKKIDPAVRIVTSTGYGDESRSQELRALNIGQTLGKPFSASSLLSALDRVLAPPQGGFSS